MMDPVSVESILAALVVIVSWVITYLENRKKAAVIKVMSDPVSVNGPEKRAALAELPERSWRMSEDTKKWLLASESKEDKACILEQIDTAEVNQQLRYQIVYSLGGYDIEYGLIKSSWRSK